MSKVDRIIDNKWVQNLFVWFFVGATLAIAQYEDKIATALVTILVIAPPIYVNNLLVMPLMRKKLLSFIVLFVLNIVVFTGIDALFLSVFLDLEFEMRMLNLIGLLMLAVIFGSAVKLARDSFERRHQEKLVELKLLKGQLNPHFLFNTLNNLYGLSVIKSDKLPNLMLKLSDLLRYSLYETKEAFVPLRKETEYLENYIILESIRLEEKVSIEFNKTGLEHAADKQIAPMLLIVFVENAFKHLGDPSDDQAKVKIDLMVDKDKLEFKCTNTFGEVDRSNLHLEGKESESGIGLKNVKKRLDLIYNGQHTYRVSSINNEFIVELKLVL